MKHRWNWMVESAKNFHGDLELFLKQIEKMELFYTSFQVLYQSIIVDLDKLRGLRSEQVLEICFSKIYDFVIWSSDDFSVFDKDTQLHENVYNACFFTTLGMFLNDTKRIKGLSLREFLYKNSSNKYNIKESRYYFNYDNPDKTSQGYEHIKREETTLRQMRHRLLSARPVYDKQPEWSAIRKSSEHEWAFIFVLNNLENDLLDTYKRIGNLFKDLNTATEDFKKAQKTKHKFKDGGENEDYYKFEDAFKKFSSKLNKIKYEKFLELQKVILSHIYEDKTHFGMNIYRFEKRLSLYNITSEVKYLLECKNEEENRIIDKSIVLYRNNIFFPKLRQDFSVFDDLAYIEFCANTFSSFVNVIRPSSILIIDELVEKGYFGKNWEKIFLDKINEMTERVFYDPEKIDYTVTPKSQEKFVKIISSPVLYAIYGDSASIEPPPRKQSHVLK